MAIIGSTLVGGLVSIRPKENIRDIQTRLLSPGALTKRVALIDNLKISQYSNSEIEGLVTSSPISGRQMFTGEGQRPNTLVWVITANKPSLSKDLAQRSVMVRLATPEYTSKWEPSVLAYIETNRWAIIADCVREIRQVASVPIDSPVSRWPEWEADIVAKLPESAAVLDALASRRRAVDADDKTYEAVTEAVRRLLARAGFDPECDCVLIPSDELHCEVVAMVTGQEMTKPTAMKWLYEVGVECLKRSDNKSSYTGGVWRPSTGGPAVPPKMWSERSNVNFRSTGQSE